MTKREKKKEETHRITLDIPKSVWIAARKQAITEDSTPKKILEQKLL